VTAPTDDLEITVKGHGQIRGRVSQTENGQALVDFEVSYRPASRDGVHFFFGGPGGGGPNDPRSFHAEDGAFVLENVPPGTWTVEARADGFQAGTASGVVLEEGGSTEVVEIGLSKGGTIVGHVVETQSGRPILDATVHAELSGGGGRRMPRLMGGGNTEAMTDADGQYEITGLTPGTWAVTASHPEWSEASVTVELEDAPTTADLRLGTGGAIEGVVLAAGRPVAGAEVSLAEAGEAGLRGFGSGQGSLTGEDGRFRFERLSPGRYTLYSSLRSQSSDPVEAVVTGDASQDVTLILDEGPSSAGPSLASPIRSSPVSRSPRTGPTDTSRPPDPAPTPRSSSPGCPRGPSLFGPPPATSSTPPARRTRRSRSGPGRPTPMRRSSSRWGFGSRAASAGAGSPWSTRS